MSEPQKDPFDALTARSDPSFLRRSILLVDGDTKGRRVVELSLRKAGYEVLLAQSAGEALRIAERRLPDVIISEIALPQTNGLALCRAIRDEPRLKDIPFLILTTEKSIDHKLNGLQLGVTDYLTKPIYIREVLTRIEILIEKREREEAERAEPRSRFAGNLASMSVIDIMQTVDIGRKSGIVSFSKHSGDAGQIFFREGQVIDAEAGPLQGELAVYRLMGWTQGEFSIHFTEIIREESVQRTTQGLLMEGARRQDELARMSEGFPLSQILITKFKPSDSPEELRIAELADGARPVGHMLELSPYGDLETLAVIKDLFGRGILGPMVRSTRELQPDELTEIDQIISQTFSKAFDAALEGPAQPQLTSANSQIDSLVNSAPHQAQSPLKPTAPAAPPKVVARPDEAPIRPRPTRIQRGPVVLTKKEEETTLSKPLKRSLDGWSLALAFAMGMIIHGVLMLVWVRVIQAGGQKNDFIAESAPAMREYALPAIDHNPETQPAPSTKLPTLAGNRRAEARRLHQRARQLHNIGRNREALKMLKRALGDEVELTADQIAGMHLTCAEVCLDLGRTERAIGHIQRVQQIWHHNPDALLLLGQTYDVRGDREAAKATYRQLIEEHPNFPSSRQVQKMIDLGPIR